MSATNTTPHYELPSFLATDKPAWLVDWNGAMAKIDAGIYQAQQSANQSSTDISALSQSLATLSGTVDSQGLTISTLSQSLTTAIGNINTINSLIGNGTPTTTDQTIIGAINEINARTGEAEGISYHNTDSGLSATNVQGAIDENASAIALLNSATYLNTINSTTATNIDITNYNTIRIVLVEANRVVETLNLPKSLLIDLFTNRSVTRVDLAGTANRVLIESISNNIISVKMAVSDTSYGIIYGA